MKSLIWLFPLIVLALAGCAASSGNKSLAPGAVAITVTEKGFEPAVVTVTQGRPVTLVVTRKTEHTCATEFVLAEQDIRKELPLGKPVEITFTPAHAGELRYACGMDMLSGKIVVQ